ncbi:phosphoribosylglycinamide formyltransferase 1 [Malassezia vespertilionis]|uniref:phosphoribosylglycinamide formyltransferase 1 n=1 Tax=Malassezia vespertilionis TaxID=2020962 RepID=A0A2N1J934_9BASI|nr:phosphoribosylglycinamide formyltransferase 1 [Malassezia vespertilionis]PKI83069.1 hypothetical protein MVES_002869 [Malassezia vespertilionis]WFD07660.1 phosphoribosylglycinamide formyltransferase 1 [Malassezia vespertilionis]
MAAEEREASASLRRTESLLARYGGENGPTGHASVGDGHAPVSLAAFMGGKAHEPRLGKLQGDGRTSPPEASLGDRQKYHGLPGMAKPEGSMASFLEKRHEELHGKDADERPVGRNDMGASDECTTVADAAKTDLPAAKPLRSTHGKRIVVLISGSGSNLQALIDATCEPNPTIRDAQIVRVLSNRMSASGLQRAKNVEPPIPTVVHSLKTFQNRNPGKTREDYDVVLAERVLGDEAPPDLVVLAGFMHIVSETFLSALGHATSLAHPPTFSHRPTHPIAIINLHPALPGAFDGANAIDRAYDAFQRGEIQHTGVMVHKVVAEVDRGAPILVQNVPIYKGEPRAALEERMHAVEHRLIVDATIKVLAGEELPFFARVSGTELEPLDTEWPVLHDTDSAVLVHGTTAYLWRGECAASSTPPGALAKLGTSHQVVHQGSEPPAFLHALRHLVTRHNTVSTCDAQLFTVRGDGVLIDEVDPAAPTLSAAFSAVARTPAYVYVWHGRGSDDTQRHSAEAFARTLHGQPVVVEQGADGAWWQLFPTQDYANGWHILHRRSLPAQRMPALYPTHDAAAPVPFTSAALKPDAVAILDDQLELYVLIGRCAHDSDSIYAALDRAEAMAAAAQAVRGGGTAMRPPVHVLTFPTIVPTDLRVLSRGRWDDAHLQGSQPPLLLRSATAADARISRRVAHSHRARGAAGAKPEIT